MKRLAFTVALLLMAPAALAANPYGNCTQAAIDLGACRVGSVAWFAFDVTDSALVTDIQAWAVDEGGYQSTIPCGQTEVRTRGILEQAGVTEGTCAAGELGTTISNPQTVNDFAYHYMRNILRDRLREWQKRDQEETAIEALPAVPDPDFGDGEP